MNRRTLAVGLVSIPLAAQVTRVPPGVSPVPFTESRQSVRAFSASGEITLPTVRLQVDVPNPAKKERGDLLVIYDPQTGLYLWRYSELNSSGGSYDLLEPMAARQALYVETDRIINFVYNWPWTVEYRDRAGSLDAAKEAVFGWLLGGHPTLTKHGGKPGSPPALVSPEDRRKILESPSIPHEFFCGYQLREVCSEFSQTQIMSVSKKGELWRLVLRNHWDQELILDSKFSPVSTRQLTLP